MIAGAVKFTGGIALRLKRSEPMVPLQFPPEESYARMLFCKVTLALPGVTIPLGSWEG